MTYYDHATRTALETALQCNHQPLANWKMERELAERRLLSRQTRPRHRSSRKTMSHLLSFHGAWEAWKALAKTGVHLFSVQRQDISG